MHVYTLSQSYEPASSESLKIYESDPERVFTPPPSHPPPRLHYTNKVSVTD